ncbi:MAG: hypothetical protein ACOC8K_08130, partial [Gemmatimonadota bacterium]
DCNLQGALVFVDRIQLETSLLEEKYGLRVAVGVAAYEERMKVSDELLDAAKRALARSVEMGAGSVSTSRDV